MIEASSSTAPKSSQPPKPLSLRANFTWTFIGNVVYAASSWGMVVALAKLGTPEIVGQFALGLAVTAPVIMLANLQLRAIQATDARHEYLFRDYFGLRLIMLGVALLLIAGIVLFSSYQRELGLTIWVIGFGKAVDAISDVIYGILQQYERMDRISISLILKGILSLMMLAGAQYWTHSVLWAAIGWALASVIIVIFYDIHSAVLILKSQPDLADKLRPRFNPPILAKLTRLSLPLGITMLLISLNSNIPRYFIERYSGTTNLGIFAAMAYLMTAGGTVIGALGQSASPRLAKQYTSGDTRSFQALLVRLVLIGAILGVGGITVALIAGRQLLALLYQPEYAKQVDVFVWLMAAAGISYVASFMGYGVTATRHFIFQPPILAITGLCTFLLCILFIPTYGIRGAAWAIFLANMVQLSLMIFYQVHALRVSSKQGTS